MKVADSGRNNVAFKSFYMVKGHNDELDEVCWYLRKKLAKTEQHGMDFLDIRLNNEPQSTMQRLFAPPNEAVKGVEDAKTSYQITPSNRFIRHTETKLDTETSQFDLSYELLQSRQWKNRDRIKPITDVDGADLIITDNDKPAVERAMDNMIDESSQTKFSGRSIAENSRILVDNICEAKQKMLKGFPIVNLKQNIVRQFLPLQFLEIPILKAKEVLEQIERNRFNPHTGLNLQG